MKNKKNTQDSQEENFESPEYFFESPEYREASREFLRDFKKSGKIKDWEKPINVAVEVAKSCLNTPGLERYGERMLQCGRQLGFEACVIPEHGKKLVRANFCKYRMCPVCQPIKASKVRQEVFDIVSAHLEKFPTDVPILLTLTSPNIPGELIGKKIDSDGKAFERLIKRKVVRQMNSAWFRSLEITKNQDRGDYHPHYHIILMVKAEYFNPNSPLYITHAQWLKLWQEAQRDLSITQVDVRVIKDKGQGKLEALIAEVAKYATKPSSYISKKGGKIIVDKQALEDLHYGLKGRRTIGYGGYFKEVRKELKLRKLEEKAIKAAESLNEDGTTKPKEPSRCRECDRPMVPEDYTFIDKIKRFCLDKHHGHGHDHGPSP